MSTNAPVALTKEQLATVQKGAELIGKIQFFRQNLINIQEGREPDTEEQKVAKKKLWDASSKIQIELMSALKVSAFNDVERLEKEFEQLSTATSAQTPPTNIPKIDRLT